MKMLQILKLEKYTKMKQKFILNIQVYFNLLNLVTM